MGRVRVAIGNRSPGGLWWRAPLAILLWLPPAGAFVAALAVLATLRGYAADLPTAPDLERWQAALPRTTRVVAADGTTLAVVPFDDRGTAGHRFVVARSDLPRVLVEAILAAEDVRFFAHHGVDARAVARAAWANWRAGRVVEGASTLTQQLARAVLPEEIGRSESLRRKVREALVARRLERLAGKQRILAAYANAVFLGAGAYGVVAAARAYFDKPLAALDLAESATIAGLAQAPGRADPYKDPAACRARRDQVLDRMLQAGFIDAASHAAARARPLELTPPSPSFGALAPWSTERARRELVGHAEWARGGLTIETVAEPALDTSARAIAERHAARLGEGRASGAPEVAALAIDRATGYARVHLGGRRFRDSQFDRVAQACRQPGSAFKPIVYAAALEAGAITPATALRDAPVAEYDDRSGHWKPRSSGRGFRGLVLAHDALAASLNPPAIDVLDRVGAARAIALARRLGITSELTTRRPLALGASCVVPLELGAAYAVFAGDGAPATPITVTRVRRGAEVLLDRASPFDPTLDAGRRLDRLIDRAVSAPAPVLDAAVAYQIAAMLRDVVVRGTASAARGATYPAAGKTGTTNDATDAWFVGYTARTLAVVWLGHDDPKKTLGPKDDGGRAALPLWLELVAAIEDGRAALPVLGAPPPGLVRAVVDRQSGLLAAPGHGGAAELYFRPGTEPTERAGAAGSDLSRLSSEF